MDDGRQYLVQYIMQSQAGFFLMLGTMCVEGFVQVVGSVFERDLTGKIECRNSRGQALRPLLPHKPEKSQGAQGLCSRERFSKGQCLTGFPPKLSGKMRSLRKSTRLNAFGVQKFTHRQSGQYFFTLL